MGDDFSSISVQLKRATLSKRDFEEALEDAQRGDLVYVDPPYTVKHNNNGFLKYNEVIFSWRDQIRLRDAVGSAAKRGAFVLVSNADHSSIREIYTGLGEIIPLSRASVISGPNEGRGRYGEVLIRCY
jgi:DNA adenine methylase